MKPEDLMLGDWVSYSEHTIEQLMSFMASSIRGRKSFEIPKYLKVTKTMFRTSYQFEPILITDDILSKNGFTLRLDEWYLEDFDGYKNHVWIYPSYLSDDDDMLLVDMSNDDNSIMIEIKYVHELQHALKLCKIEKEIIL